MQDLEQYGEIYLSLFGATWSKQESYTGGKRAERSISSNNAPVAACYAHTWKSVKRSLRRQPPQAQDEQRRSSEVAMSRKARERGYKIKLAAKSRKIDDKVVAMVIPQFVNEKSELYKVEREFNGVIVEGAFSEHQFFIGKGAGGYPTGSAVLSDISALTYNYRYEYKKTKQAAGLQISSDHDITIYLRFNDSSLIEKDLFSDVLEEYKALDNQYIIGRINFKKLIASSWTKDPNNNIILIETNYE